MAASILPIQHAGRLEDGTIMHRFRNGRTLARSLSAAVAMLTTPAATGQDSCVNIAVGRGFPGATIESTRMAPADAANGMPPFCEIEVSISPAERSHIGATYRLPVRWNGRILGLGGGGAAGNVSIHATGVATGLSRGYAVIQNDLGHSGTSGTDWSFAVAAPGQPNIDAIIDFGHRATHFATTVGKDVVARYYGRRAERAYWQGCSTGGRQGLAEVQRYPDDYDGVIAGAPVHSPVVYSSAMLRVQAFHAKPESNLLAAHVPLIQKAVLAACDANDGVADGILTDPRACTWDPGELECKNGSSSSSCLTPAQVETVRRVYAGVKTRDGRFAAMPLMRGGESDWVTRMIGTPDMPRGLNALLGARFMGYVVKSDAAYDFMQFDPDRDMAALDGGLAAEHVHQQNPDLKAFVARRGKLLLWHGFNDPGPSPLSTIAYFDAVRERVAAARDAVRLFLVPGVLHCGGGPGPDRFDALSALEEWVEKDRPPASIIATKSNSQLSRPLCPYPELPRYKRTGDPLNAESFECATP